MSSSRVLELHDRPLLRVVLLSSLVLLLSSVDAVSAQDAAPAPSGDWRTLNPENTLYFELDGGRVVIELAPQFALRHVENIKALVRAGLFDGGGVVRSQDNYVAQWAIRSDDASPVPQFATAGLDAELTVPAGEVAFTAIGDRDAYAEETGFVAGFPAARDPKASLVWIPHCYGVVAVARGSDPNSGNGSQLYAVTGHAPRHLDRNLTVVGRVVSGMELLSTLPRGTGRLGFFESKDEVPPIRSAKVAADLPSEERGSLELMRTDSAAFAAHIKARRTPSNEFFVHKANAVDVCNVAIPTRPAR